MGEGIKKIPILLYHALDPGMLYREKYAVKRREFEKQLKYLRDNNFAVYSIDDIFAPDRNNGGIRGERKGIILSFDDGNSSDYTLAFPILLQFGFKGVFFVTTEKVGTPGYVTWEQLKSMTEKEMSIQSHGVSHSYLSEMNEGQMAQELFESKELIEKKMRTPVNYFSLPGGFGSPKVIEVAKKFGFSGVCTSIPGLNPVHSGEKRFRVLKRFVITSQTTFQSFQALMEGQKNLLLTSHAKEQIKTLIKKMIGPRRYSYLWAKYFKYLSKA